MEKIDASVGSAGGKPCYNIPKDQETIQRLLSKIPASQGGCAGKGWKPALWGVCAQDLADAIRKFQEANRAKLAFPPDGHIDPDGSTLALLNALASGTPTSASPPATGLTQSALALKVVGLGVSWCQAAINALQTYGITFATGTQDADSLVAKALNVHFHLDQISDRSKAAAQMDSILANYTEIKHTLMSTTSAFKDVTTSEAAPFFPKDSGTAGWAPPPAFVSRKDGKKWIFFTPSFQEWSSAKPGGYGPNARTAMVVHEAGHYIDDAIIDYAYEWTNASAGINLGAACVPGSDPKCLYYAALTPEQALNNASCYPSFAAHIVRKFDSPSTRYGAGNPSL
jgi:hypothetical protein